MKLILLALLSIISNSALAALPFTFTDGQPAIADQVNKNFSFLDDKIVQTTNCSLSDSGVAFTYQRKNVALGTLITVGRNRFTVIKTPFIDIASGIKYNLTFPAFTSFTAAPPITRMAVNYQMANKDNFCSSGKISGFPVNSMSFNVNSRITYFQSLDTNNILFTVSKNFEILVGSTIVNFEIISSVLTQASVYLDPANPDYTQSYDPLNMVAPTTFIQEMDDLIDTIIIEKAP